MNSVAEPFPAELNRVARGWPLGSKCRQRLQFAHSRLINALAALHEGADNDRMIALNSAWAFACRELDRCGEYKPGPSGTPSEGNKEKAA